MDVNETPEKLIAQNYDGAPVMGGSKNGALVKIRAKYPNALSIHCYAHQLNLIVKRCVIGNNQDCFFLYQFGKILHFHFQSSKRTAVLDLSLIHI